MVALRKLLIAPLFACMVHGQLQAVANALSRQFIRMAVNFRAAGITPVQASSELDHMITVPLHYPAFNRLMNKAAGALMRGRVNDQSLISLLDEGVKAYNDFSKNGAVFQPYSAYVKSNLYHFDVARAESLLVQQLRPLASRLTGPLNAFLQDPNGRKMGSTAISLANHVASDFGVEKYLSSIPEYKLAAQQLGIK